MYMKKNSIQSVIGMVKGMSALFLFALSPLLVACGNSEKEYDATGTFEATEVTVSAKSTGELKVFNVAEGQVVENGAVVGRIDAYQLQMAHEQLEAQKRQLSSTRNATNSRQLDLEKQLSTINQQIVNAERERDATREQIRSNNASLAEQSKGIGAQIDGIEAQKRQIADQIANTEIKAPLTGSVLEKYVEQGEFVTTGKPLFKVADTQNTFLRAYITSAQLQNIKVGQKVKVFADYGNGQKKAYDGTVSWISTRSEFTPKTILTDDERADLVYAVKVAIKNDGYIKIGMYGELKTEN